MGNKKLNIQKYKHPSSPARRAEAAERYAALSTRKKEVEAELQPLRKTWVRDLMEVARFAVDVNGGEPSMSQLRNAVENAERFNDLSAELVALNESTRQASSERLYYQWHAGNIQGVGGIAFSVQVTEADSRKELNDKIKEIRCRSHG